MGAIFGRINGSGRPVARGSLETMGAVLAHRGPAAQGLQVDGEAGLGFRSMSGARSEKDILLPVTNEDGSLVAVLDGTIDNAQEIRSGLMHKGHVLRSASDAEVIPHLYEEQGSSFVESLYGPFALALWDQRRKQLILARDRVGKKPLFYQMSGKDIVFASEIKAILQDPEVECAPNLQAIHHYLTYQYVPSPLTAFQGIHKLPPGHVLVWREGKTEIAPYWNLSYSNKVPLREEEALERLEGLLRESIGTRLKNAGSVGAFLSGGLDSSAVVALTSQMLGRGIPTFSIAFAERDYDESSYARALAQRFGTQHREYLVKPDAVRVLPELVWYYNEPFADPSALPSYLAARLAREHVDLVLTGDGGDENFAGYERYQANIVGLRVQRLPKVVRHMILGGSRLLSGGAGHRSLLRKVQRLMEQLETPPEYRYGPWITYFSHENKRELYSPDFSAAVGGEDVLEGIRRLYRQSDGPDFVDQTLDVDVQTYLADDLMVKMDVACMAHSLNWRAPLLDHRIMEFAASLPSSYKLRQRLWQLETKYIFKKAAERLLPADVVHRRKRGFGVPIDHWFRKELKDFAYDTLLSQAAVERGYFNPGYVRRLLDEHTSGTRNHEYRIWCLLFLELWHQMFIDGRLPKPEPARRARGVA